MKSRKEIHKKPKNHSFKKLFIGLALLFIIIGGSVNIAFADGDIASLFNNWFNKKSSEVIEEVEHDIDEERKKQTNRLKEELQVKINEADTAIKEFGEKEKRKKVKELQAYADNLIDNFSYDHSAEKDETMRQINDIVNRAIDDMDHIASKNHSGNSESKQQDEENKDKKSDKSKNDDKKDKKSDKNKHEKNDDKSNQDNKDVKKEKEEKENHGDQ